MTAPAATSRPTSSWTVGRQGRRRRSRVPAARRSSSRASPRGRSRRRPRSNLGYDASTKSLTFRLQARHAARPGRACRSTPSIGDLLRNTTNLAGLKQAQRRPGRRRRRRRLRRHVRRAAAREHERHHAAPRQRRPGGLGPTLTDADGRTSPTATTTRSLGQVVKKTTAPTRSRPARSRAIARPRR